MKVQGLPLGALAEQRFVVAGAGSAGMGVVHMICQGEPTSASASLKVANRSRECS